jgi:hypothetical protein
LLQLINISNDVGRKQTSKQVNNASNYHKTHSRGFTWIIILPGEVSNLVLVMSKTRGLVPERLRAVAASRLVALFVFFCFRVTLQLPVLARDVQLARTSGQSA